MDLDGKAEWAIIHIMESMCRGSLSPDKYEEWHGVVAELYRNRHLLRDHQLDKMNTALRMAKLEVAVDAARVLDEKLPMEFGDLGESVAKPEVEKAWAYLHETLSHISPIPEKSI